MTNFFDLKHFRELQIILFLQLIIISISYFIMVSIPNNGINLLNIPALILSFLIWSLCSKLDHQKYFNFFSFLVNMIFGYGIYWFCFEILFNSDFHKNF